jgi:prepilin-type N-terminal cleavage/methylation domain-containing protein
MSTNCQKRRGCGGLVLRSPKSFYWDEGGFTLVELLVVIAIIALLMAILLPGLRMAKAFGKKMVCQANLKQLACAWTMYLENYDGYFYRATNAHIRYGGWVGGNNLSPRPLNKFVGLDKTLPDEKLAKVFCCPADTGGVPWRPNPGEKAIHYYGTSYLTNYFLIRSEICTPDSFLVKTKDLYTNICSRIEQLRIAQVTASSAQVVLMGDQGWFHQWRLMTPPSKEQWDQFYKSYAEWHIRPESYNLVFLDGHTAFVKIRRGYFVTDDYSVLPFKDLYGLAFQVQGEEP